MRRFDMRLPALVKFGAEQEPQFSTETQNVSARGVFFHLDHKLEKGAKIEVIKAADLEKLQKEQKEKQQAEKKEDKK